MNAAVPALRRQPAPRCRRRRGPDAPAGAGPLAGGALLALLLAGAGLSPAAARAEAGFAGPGFADPPRTHLVAIVQGSKLSNDVDSWEDRGYELSDGRWVNFSDWYASDWTDVSVTFLTEITPATGLVWGLSTGEWGAKYRIRPALKLGIATQIPTGRNSALGITAWGLIGGDLHEDTCTADYGEIGGIQRVNCRLAATELAPAKTLNYMLNREAYDRIWLSVTWSWNF